MKCAPVRHTCTCGGGLRRGGSPLFRNIEQKSNTETRRKRRGNKNRDRPNEQINRRYVPGRNTPCDASCAIAALVACDQFGRDCCRLRALKPIRNEQRKTRVRNQQHRTTLSALINNAKRKLNSNLSVTLVLLGLDQCAFVQHGPTITIQNSVIHLLEFKMHSFWLTFLIASCAATRAASAAAR